MAYYPAQAPDSYYNAPNARNPIGFNNSTDARTATRNQRQWVAGMGDALQSNDQDLANQYGAQSAATQNYLNPVESNLAAGNGGYNQTESSAINLSPQEKQNIITGAGISAGVGNAAAVGAANRASAAGGGNPLAMAAYRARAADSEGAQAGDAMTQARIGAKQAEAAGATTTGNARLAQQNQGLGYYGSLQGQQNQSALNEQGLQQGAYGTEVGGTDQATGQVLSASQTPSKFDKIAGLAGGIAAGIGTKLADGYLGGGTEAVLGENGPEAIVEAASNPVRSDTTFMADGTPGTPAPPAAPAPPKSALQRYLEDSQKLELEKQKQQQNSQPWNPTTSYKELGTGVGTLAGSLLKTGHVDTGLGNGVGGHSAASYGHMPMAPDPAKIPYKMPGGLMNRTGQSIDGTPSLAPDGSIPQPPPLPVDGVTGRPTLRLPETSAVSSVVDAASALPDATATAAEGATEAAPAIGEGVADLGSSLFAADGTMAPYRSRMMANGFPPDGPGLPQPPKIVTGPTRVHLDPGDAVVPLSYRPKAKVRPSMAMAAYAGRHRPAYGVARAN